MSAARRWARRLVASLIVSLLFAALLAPTAQAAVPPPPCRIGDVLTPKRTYSDWPRSILDTELRLASSYYPTDLTSTSNAGLNGGYRVRSFVIYQLKRMAGAARAAGARFSVVSAFRSFATQKATFDYWVDVHGYDQALLESARPGHSEHQLGTTLDFKSYGGPAPWDVADWAKTKAGAWLKANAYKYGFVMSYPKDKTTVTCYMYESWHYRFVGVTRAANVRASGLTLREYLWRQYQASL
jgi:D-alanyl-D-alanine carboxypeptidase